MKTAPCAVVGLILSACGPQVYRPGEPVALKLDSCIESSLGGRIAQDVHAGAHIWDSFGGTFDVANANEKVDVTCEASGEAVGGAWDGISASINQALWEQDIFHPDSPNFDSAIASVVAHELGHAMGLRHELDVRALMYPDALGSKPGPTDAQQLCSLYQGIAACSMAAGGLWPDPTP